MTKPDTHVTRRIDDGDDFRYTVKTCPDVLSVELTYEDDYHKGEKAIRITCGPDFAREIAKAMVACAGEIDAMNRPQEEA